MIAWIKENWKATSTGLLVIGSVIAILIFLPKSCERTTESTTQTLTAAYVTISELRAGMADFQNIIKGQEDSIWTLRTRNAKLEGQVITITKIVTRPVKVIHDTTYMNTPSIMEYPVAYVAYADTAVLRMITIDDSSYSWMDNISIAAIVRDGSVMEFKIEFMDTEIQFDTKDLEVIVGLSAWYYAGAALAILLAYIAGTVVP